MSIKSKRDASSILRRLLAVHLVLVFLSQQQHQHHLRRMSEAQPPTVESKNGSEKRAASSDLALPPPRKKSLKECLEQARLEENPKGWRAQEVGFHSKKGRRNLDFRIWRNCKLVLELPTKHEATMMGKFLPPRNKSIHCPLAIFLILRVWE